MFVFLSLPPSFLSKSRLTLLFLRTRRTSLRVTRPHSRKGDSLLTLRPAAGIALARSDDWISHSPADVGAHKAGLTLLLVLLLLTSAGARSSRSRPRRPRR